MRKIAVLAGLIAGWLLPAADYFELKSSYTTDQDQIFLGDLVKNRQLPADYAKIPLGLAPFKKNERVILADFIQETLIRQQKTAYLPRAGGSVTIQNKTAVLSAKEQEKTVRTAVDSLLKNANYKLEFRTLFKDITYPVRNKVEITLLDKNRIRMSGNQLFQIEIKLNGRIFTKVSINSFIRLFGPVLINNNKLAKNDNLSPADFTLTEKEITGFENEIISTTADLGNYKSGRLIPSGSILRKSMLKPIPVIKRGEIIQLTALDSLVEITLPATALFDCQQGEIEKFKINATAAVVPALITGPGKAELRR